MKRIIGIATLIMVISFTGCKKADNTPTYYCKNSCYLCYSSSNYKDTFSLCNTDFTAAEFQQRLEYDSITGFICKEVQPSIFHEISGNNINAQIDSQQSNRLNCYDKNSYHPLYFDYNAFVERNERCTKCYDSIAKHYLEIYFDTIDSYYGGLGNCSLCATATFCRDTAGPYSTAKINSMEMNCGVTSGSFISLPGYVYNYFRGITFDPICDTCVLTTQAEKNHWIALQSWADFNAPTIYGMNPAIFKDCH